MQKQIIITTLLFCVSNTLFGQIRKFPSLEQKKLELEQIQTSLNALCHSVLDTILKPETEPATRMEYMFFLGELRCDSCENYIVEHLSDIWMIDDMDYRNVSSPFRRAAIRKKEGNEYGRWNIVRLAWRGLSQKTRDEEYLMEIIILLAQYVYNLDSEPLITFIESEIKFNEKGYATKILVSNLKAMLKMLQEAGK